MKIKTRLRLSMLITSIVAIVAGLLLLGLERQSRELRKQSEIAQAVAESVFQQRTLTLEYVLIPHIRALIQWHIAHDEVAKALRKIGDSTGASQAFIEELYQDHETTCVLFDHLTSLVHNSDVESPTQHEGRLIITGQLLLKTQTMTSNALQLVKIVDQRMFLDQRIAAIGITVLIIGLVITVVIAAFRLMRSIGSPLQQLTKGIERIGAGDLAHRINLKTTDEIGELGAAFDNMAENLNRAQNRQAQAEQALRAVNDKLTTTVEKLRSTRQQVIQSEKMSAVGTLAAGLAHELNNPLMGAMGYVSFIGKTVQEPQLQSLIFRATRELERMRDLIRNTLDFAQPAVEGKLSIVPVPEVIGRTLALMQTEFKLQSITVTSHIADDLPPVFADADRLQQVVINLLMNARDAVEDRQKKQIDIAAYPKNEMVLLQVTDTGTGIPPADQDRIFDPFFTTKPPGKGTGLGLSVARSLVTDMGGSLTCESQEDTGAVFTITLPRAPDSADEEPADAALKTETGKEP